MAIIYTADPRIADPELVVLEDPQSLFLASHVVPLASENIDEQAEEIINSISAAMEPEDLVALNIRSAEEQLPAETIASDWLTEEGLVE